MTHKFLPHTADVKIHAEGKTVNAAFASAALALKQIILDFEKVKIKSLIKKQISVSGKDGSALLYNFLEEFLFLIDAEDFILSKITKLNIKNGKLSAEILGDKFSNYKLNNKVKAITYNEMRVVKEKNKYVIELVVDV